MNKKTIINAAFKSSVDDKLFADNLTNKKYYEIGFVKGAVWCLEKSYSEQDLREAIIKSALSNTDDLIKRCDEIIVQIKK